MTILPLLKARDLGYHYGVLKSTPVGMNLYLSLDFEKCCDISLYFQSFRKKRKT
jgi:hypothetical protein